MLSDLFICGEFFNLFQQQKCQQNYCESYNVHLLALILTPFGELLLMADKRKLQCEIDRTLKKIIEGIEVFDDMWEKVHSATNCNVKEKHEAELKKEIKKLQRLRDFVKAWLASNEVKDKNPLLEHKKLIENKMEQFKVIERETKTKAYSTVGLGIAVKVDPKEKEKDDIRAWLSSNIDALNLQVDQIESEIESIVSMSKKKKLDREKQEQVDVFRQHLVTTRFHIGRLELTMRLVDNDALDLQLINKIKESVEYYVASGSDQSQPSEDSMMWIYDDLRLDEVSEALGSKLIARLNNEGAGEDSRSNSLSESSGPGGVGGLGGGVLCGLVGGSGGGGICNNPSDPGDLATSPLGLGVSSPLFGFYREEDDRSKSAFGQSNSEMKQLNGPLHYNHLHHGGHNTVVGHHQHSQSTSSTNRSSSSLAHNNNNKLHSDETNIMDDSSRFSSFYSSTDDQLKRSSSVFGLTSDATRVAFQNYSKVAGRHSNNSKESNDPSSTKFTSNLGGQTCTSIPPLLPPSVFLSSLATQNQQQVGGGSLHHHFPNNNNNISNPPFPLSFHYNNVATNSPQQVQQSQQQLLSGLTNNQNGQQQQQQQSMFNQAGGQHLYGVVNNGQFNNGGTNGGTGQFSFNNNGVVHFGNYIGVNSSFNTPSMGANNRLGNFQSGVGFFPSNQQQQQLMMQQEQQQQQQRGHQQPFSSDQQQRDSVFSAMGLFGASTSQIGSSLFSSGNIGGNPGNNNNSFGFASSESKSGNSVVTEVVLNGTAVSDFTSVVSNPLASSAVVTSASVSMSTFAVFSSSAATSVSTKTLNPGSKIVLQRNSTSVVAVDQQQKNKSGDSIEATEKSTGQVKGQGRESPAVRTTPNGLLSGGGEEDENLLGNGVGVGGGKSLKELSFAASLKNSGVGDFLLDRVESSPKVGAVFPVSLNNTIGRLISLSTNNDSASQDSAPASSNGDRSGNVKAGKMGRDINSDQSNDSNVSTGNSVSATTSDSSTRFATSIVLADSSDNRVASNLMNSIGSQQQQQQQQGGNINNNYNQQLRTFTPAASNNNSLATSNNLNPSSLVGGTYQQQQLQNLHINNNSHQDHQSRSSNPNSTLTIGQQNQHQQQQSLFGSLGITGIFDESVVLQHLLGQSGGGSSSSVANRIIGNGVVVGSCPVDGARTVVMNPKLGVAPLGTHSLDRSNRLQQLMLDSAATHLPNVVDSERMRLFLPRNPIPVPNYYGHPNPPQFDSAEFFNQLHIETLFFVFYYMEGSKAQFLAAKALKLKSWRFHTKHLMWFQRHEEPKVITEEFEQGSYIFFDFEKWKQRQQDEFTFEYKYLEDQELV